MFPEAARVFFHTSKYFVPQIPYSVACTLVNFSFHPPLPIVQWHLCLMSFTTLQRYTLSENVSFVEFSKYFVMFIYFQAAVSTLLAVSVLYVEKKNQNQYYVLFRNVDNLMHSKSTHDEIHLTSKSVFNCFEQICTMKTM